MCQTPRHQMIQSRRQRLKLSSHSKPHLLRTVNRHDDLIQVCRDSLTSPALRFLLRLGLVCEIAAHLVEGDSAEAPGFLLGKPLQLAPPGRGKLKTRRLAFFGGRLLGAILVLSLWLLLRSSFLLLSTWSGFLFTLLCRLLQQELGHGILSPPRAAGPFSQFLFFWSGGSPLLGSASLLRPPPARCPLVLEQPSFPWPGWPRCSRLTPKS